MPVKSLIKEGVKKWLQKSVESELYASSVYKSIANQFQYMGLLGAQSFFLKESEDELRHYQKLADFVNDMGDMVDVPAVKKPEASVSNIGEALSAAYELELQLLRQYEDFYEESEDKYKDCVVATFVIKFLEIQRKAVGEYGDLIATYEKIEVNKDIIMDEKLKG